MLVFGNYNPNCVLSGFLIRENEIRFTTEYVAGLQIQRTQELGLQITLTVPQLLYIYGEADIWQDRGFKKQIE